MWCSMAAVVGAMLLGDAGGSPVIRADDFEAWFRSAAGGGLEVPAAVAERARSFRYVFVEGFRNERMPGYFSQNIAELKAHGVLKGAIAVIEPSSGRSMEDNAVAVRARFLEIAGSGPEKLVIIAHSRGACDTLAFALGNAPFVRDRVEALFLIQGPFGGSGVAEYVIGRGTPMDRRMPLGPRILGHLAGRLTRAVAGVTGLEILGEMTREASRAFWILAIEEHADAIAAVGPRTFYIRSEIKPARLRFVRRAIATYLQTYHGASDGMVALEDQALADLGTVIGTFEAGHSDLTHRFPASKAPRKLRKALIRSILMAVGRADPVPTARGELPAPIGPGRDVAPEVRPSEPIRGRQADRAGTSGRRQRRRPRGRWRSGCRPCPRSPRHSRRPG